MAPMFNLFIINAILILLKLSGALTASWWLVMLPLIIWAGLLLIFTAAAGTAYALTRRY